MRIAEYKQISSETITTTILVDDIDEAGEVIGQHTESITKTVPVMGMVYRDATPEEIAEAERMAAEMPEEPANEMAERIEMLEEALVELAGMIGGV